MEVEADIQGNGLADVAAPEIQVQVLPIGKKMSQKERKKMEREMREHTGISIDSSRVWSVWHSR